MRSATLAAVVGLVFLIPASAWAGRPLLIDDAEPVGWKQFELEGGVAYLHEDDTKHWDFPLALTYGLLEGTEFGVGFGGQSEERLEIAEDEEASEQVSESGIGDLMLAAKTKLLDERTWLPGQAISGSVKFPTADEDRGMGSGKTDVDLTWIATKTLGDKVNMHVNGGYTWVGEPEGEDVGNIIHYGVALDYAFAEPLQWVGEVFAEREMQDGTDTIWAANTGFRWAAYEELVLDVALGWGLSNDAPEFQATAGFTWAFGFRDSTKN